MTFRRVPDYERPDDSDQDNVYEVEIRPYDGRYYGSHEVMVMVEDVNEITGPATLEPVGKLRRCPGNLQGHRPGRPHS